MPGSTRNIPNFLRARTPQALRALMLKTNTAVAKEFRYFDIQAVPDEKGHVWWWAWYYEEIELVPNG